MKVVLAALGITVALAWLYLLSGAGMPKMDMGGGKVMLMPPPSWDLGYSALMFAMWTVMMVAMMLPSAAPQIVRVANTDGASAGSFFAAGYVIVWTGFSAAATFAQYAFDSAHLLSDAMALRSGVAAGAIVVGAALYQVSGFKRSCLMRCCSGLHDEEPTGDALPALRRGLNYGVSCVGCCWTLMCLLFVVGVMNILWTVALTLWVLAEKSLPWGLRLARASALGLLGWGSVALALAIR